MDSHPITPQGASPASSVEADIPSSQPILDELLPNTQDTQDYQECSPPPPPSSITPPPSTQPPPPRRAPVPNEAEINMAKRTAAPNSSASSPPPLSGQEGSTRRDVSSSGTYIKPSQASIAQSSRSELEGMLQKAMAEIDRLGLQVRESRMSAAHFKLQHKLLSIDTQETIKRMEIEHEMTRREVEVLQLSEQFHQPQAEPAADPEYVGKLKDYCQALHNDLDTIFRRFREAKKALKRKDEDTRALTDENGRLLRRIRENREHLSQLRSPGGIFATLTPRTYPSTPQQYRKKHTRATGRSQARDGSSEPFAALLLADRVISQKNDARHEIPHNSAPTTPVLARTPIKHHQLGHGHTRAAHSLSSLPTTPVHSSYATRDGGLLPSVQFIAQSEPRYRTSTGMHGPFSHQNPTPVRKRKSRDSTISASDGEGGYAGDNGSEEEVEESQASQSATAMLRRDPRESFKVVGTPPRASTPTSEVGAKSNLLQAKIFGTVTKPGVEKRKGSHDAGSRGPQKVRRLGEGVGLGIGGWNSPQM